jgi:NAD(P)-dependent dehydrogenase (short-subunit alcohol dehydrogenase family)
MSARNATAPEVVWVAGVGASAGLGAAVARRFAREGYTVAVTGRTLERIEAVAREIRDDGGEAHAFAGDVSRESDVTAIADEVSALGSLRVAVFNAASTISAGSSQVTVAALESALRTTTVGGFVFGREAVRRLLPRKRGTLLFTGGTGPLRARSSFAAFAASRAALRSLSQTLARDFGPRGIHVAHVAIDGAAAEGVPAGAFAPDGHGPRVLDDIADVYWHLHVQPRSAWTQELDFRPHRQAL